MTVETEGLNPFYRSLADSYLVQNMLSPTAPEIASDTVLTYSAPLAQIAIGLVDVISFGGRLVGIPQITPQGLEFTFYTQHGPQTREKIGSVLLREGEIMDVRSNVGNKPQRYEEDPQQTIINPGFSILEGRMRNTGISLKEVVTPVQLVGQPHTILMFRGSQLYLEHMGKEKPQPTGIFVR